MKGRRRCAAVLLLQSSFGVLQHQLHTSLRVHHRNHVFIVICGLLRRRTIVRFRRAKLLLSKSLCPLLDVLEEAPPRHFSYRSAPLSMLFCWGSIRCSNLGLIIVLEPGGGPDLHRGRWHRRVGGADGCGGTSSADAGRKQSVEDGPAATTLMVHRSAVTVCAGVRGPSLA